MGHVFAHIKLSNPRRPELAAVEVKALVDTGALMLCIPEHLVLQLDLETESEREVSVADGRRRKVPYVGPVKVAFGNRFCYVGALVLGDEVLLGAVPLEDMDLVVSPGRREVTVDPQSPNIPHARVKTMAYAQRNEPFEAIPTL
jgi:clan AA aspartic protease